MQLQQRGSKTATLILIFTFFIVTATVMPAPAFSEDDDADVSETVVVYSKKKKERGGACASCGSITFRIPNSASIARGKTTVDYETSRRPNEADAALLFQCASLLEQIMNRSKEAWIAPGTARQQKIADQRNALIEQFNETCASLFPDNPDLALDLANTAYESN